VIAIQLHLLLTHAHHARRPRANPNETPAMPDELSGDETRESSFFATPPIGDKILFTESEAAELLSISKRTLWDLSKDGRIPCVRIGVLKRYRRASLEAWAEREESHPQQPIVRRRPA
jgi:excisionase family DNA binding protein